MQKNFGSHLLNAAIITAILLLLYVCFIEPYNTQLRILLYLSVAFLVIRLWLTALNRICRSRLSDTLKLCWTLLVVFVPVIGSIATLCVVKK